MKKLLLLASLLALPLYADAPAVSLSAEYPWRVQCDVVYDVNGSLISAPVQVYFHKDVISGGLAIAKQETGIVQWDAVKSGAKTVTVGGKTYTYGEIMSAVIAISAQEKAAN